MRGFNQEIGLGDITVAKRRLIEILTVNRDNHHQTFVTACEAFRKLAITELDAVIDIIQKGKLPKMVGTRLPVPEEHTDDYDRAIDMLEMHEGDTITLSEGAYARLVNDDWGWRDAFLGNTASYLDR